MNTTHEEPAQSLCKSCGLCCDGTLFSHVSLEPHEDKYKCLNLNLHDAGDKGIEVLQPCAAFNPRKGCEVYERRPHKCRKFHCRLLRMLQAESITLMDAIAKVELIMNEREKVLAEIDRTASFIESCTLASKFDLLFNSDKGDLAIGQRRDFAEVHLAYAALTFLLGKYLVPRIISYEGPSQHEMLND